MLAILVRMSQIIIDPNLIEAEAQKRAAQILTDELVAKRAEVLVAEFKRPVEVIPAPEVPKK